MPSVVFVLNIGLQMKFSLSSNFAKSWECDKDAYTCFIALDKAYDQIPREKL